MPDQQHNRWVYSWKKHRQELGVWVFAVVFYVFFMIDVEPSKYTRGMMFLIFFIPPFFLLRFFVSARKFQSLAERESVQDYEGQK